MEKKKPKQPSYDEMTGIMLLVFIFSMMLFDTSL